MADSSGFFAELNKIPPVTRTLVLSTITVTLLPKLAIVSAYPFLLWWPAVWRKWQFWRLFTAFLLDPAPQIQPLFDIFMLYRSSNDLELNTYTRSTSRYAWALLIVATGIIATNYPLESPLLFSPMLSALTYLWSRANPHSRVSFFGFISIPALYLPYAYLGLDLLMGGLPHAMHSATGILSAYAYHYLDAVLPASSGGHGPRYLPGPPAWFRRLLPDSVDPAFAGERGGGEAYRAQGRTARTTGWGGTAFAPRGRSFGDGRGAEAASASASAASGGQRLGTPTGATARSWLSWIPSFGGASTGTTTGGGGGGVAGTGGAARRADAPTRQAMLAAAEARLRAQRERSIAGRNEAAARAAAQASEAAAASSRGSGSGSGSGSSGSSSTAGATYAGRAQGQGSSALASSSSSAKETVVRRNGAAQPPPPSSPLTSAAPQGPTRSFAELQAREERLADREGTPSGRGGAGRRFESASGSGGRVAEVRRRDDDQDDGGEDNEDDDEAGGSNGAAPAEGGRGSGGGATTGPHSWGEGRRLGD